MANIIIRKPDSFGSTRSERERNLNTEGMYSMTEEQTDKCKFAERKLREQTGMKKNNLSQYHIDKVK